MCVCVYSDIRALYTCVCVTSSAVASMTVALQSFSHRFHSAVFIFRFAREKGEMALFELLANSDHVPSELRKIKSRPLLRNFNRKPPHERFRAEQKIYVRFNAITTILIEGGFFNAESCELSYDGWFRQLSRS